MGWESPYTQHFKFGIRPNKSRKLAELVHEDVDRYRSRICDNSLNNISIIVLTGSLLKFKDTGTFFWNAMNVSRKSSRTA
jgi:hypothetical protein